MLFKNSLIVSHMYIINFGHFQNPHSPLSLLTCLPWRRVLWTPRVDLTSRFSCLSLQNAVMTPTAPGLYAGQKSRKSHPGRWVCKYFIAFSGRDFLEVHILEGYISDQTKGVNGPSSARSLGLPNTARSPKLISKCPFPSQSVNTTQSQSRPRDQRPALNQIPKTCN